MEISIVNPCEIAHLFRSLNNISKILEILDESNLCDNLNQLHNIKVKETLEDLNNFTKKWESKFDIEKMERINFVNYIEDDTSFFKPNIYQTIDNIQEEIDTCNNFLDKLVTCLSKYIDDKNYFYKNKELINIKFNERDGHYLMLTNRRCRLLRKSIEKKKTIKVGTIDLKVENLEFIELPRSSNTKIKCEKLNNLSAELVEYKQKLAKELKNTFYIEIKDIIENSGKNLRNYCNLAGLIDFINSGAIVANKLGYCKPEINNKYKGTYFNASELRHPIVEQLNEKVSYCPHNISLEKTVECTLWNK